MHQLLLLLLLSLSSSATSSPFDFRADLTRAHAGSHLSKQELLRRAARASKIRASRLAARACGRDTQFSGTDVSIQPIADDHVLTVGIGTPPEPHTLLLDTGSDLIWTNCKPTTKSSSFSLPPCSNKLCREGVFSTKNCTHNACVYTTAYGSGTAEGVLASEIFTFGSKHKARVRLGFGCGRLDSGSLEGASGIMGMSPESLSLISQLSIPKFSYCLTPFGSDKTSPLLFGSLADLSKYKTTGAIQTTSILKNPTTDSYYYLPLVGLSVGTKRLLIPVSHFTLKADGTGGTMIDSGSTISSLEATAFHAVTKAMRLQIKLPAANHTVGDFELCFVLPSGMSMEMVEVPRLVYHFDGGAHMDLPRENYFEEPAPGFMCLAISKADTDTNLSVIGNIQHQNMHVLFDVQNQKFSFAPTQCDQL